MPRQVKDEETPLGDTDQKKNKKKGLNGRWRSIPSFRASFRRQSEPELEEVDEEEEGGVGAENRVRDIELQAVGEERKRKTLDDEGMDIEHVGCLSHIFLSWITSLIRTGYQHRQLETDDLWRLRSVDDPEMLSEKLLETLETLRDENGEFISYAIWRAAYRMFKRDLILSFVYEVIFEALRFSGPVLLRLLVLALEDGTANSAKGYGYAAGLFLAQFLSTMFQAHARFLSATIGLQLKNALSLAVFKHVLRLDQEGKAKVSNGQVVNLLSTDAQVPVEFMRQWNRFITAPFVLVAGIAYIYVYVGPSVFFGVLLMALFVPVSIKFGKVQTQYQRKKMEHTDTRVKLVNEMMLGIKVLKLNAWEKPLLSFLNAVRGIEMKAISRLHYYRGVTMPFAIAIPNIASVITFGAYILLGNEITPANTFAVVSAFVIIRAPFVTLPLAITMFTRALVSARRFKEFFSLSAHESHASTTVSSSASFASPSSGALVAGAGSFHALGELDSSIELKTHEDTGEQHTEEEKVKEEEDIVVAANNATFSWTFSMKEVDKKKEKNSKGMKRKKTNGAATQSEAVSDKSGHEAESPLSDLRPFRLENLNFAVKRGELVAVVGRIGDGKSSLISAMLGEMRVLEGNISIQGSLALCTQEPFIMNRTVRDNILFESPLDIARYNATLEACALVSDLRMLPASDLTEIGERGVNLSGGQKARVSLARAVYAQPQVVLLDDPLSAVDAHVGKHIFTHCIGNFPGAALSNATRIFVTNQLHLLPYMDRIIMLEDGKIVEQGTFSEIMQRENSKIKDLQAKYSLEKQEEIEEIPSIDAELEDVSLISAEDLVVKEKAKTSPAASLASALGVASIQQTDLETERKEKMKGLLIKEEGREQGQIKFSVVSSYWLAGSLNSWLITLLVLSSFFITEAVFLAIDSWLAFYSQQSDLPEDDQYSEKFFLGVYFGITAAFFTVLMIRAVVYAAFSIQACKVLYYNLQNNVFYLPMEFFWQTPLGRVLNRLSKDTNDTDVMLPQQMQWLIMTMVRVLGVLAIISFTVPIFLVAIVPFMLIYYGIREYYRRASVSTQRIESVLRSPIYSHLSETMHGVSTLKAFQRTKPWLLVAKTLIALNHRAHFAVESIQIWLSMRLEFLGALIVFVTAVCIVATDAKPGLAGLALSYSLNIIINLNMSVQMATQVESKMNAVERMLEYSDIENENKPGEQSKPDQWPTKGHLQLENVSLRYREALEPAIRNVSLDIPAGAKCGIAGATGSGKSTLMVALFRLAPISSGRLLIDDVDTAKLSLEDVRSAITCIPQDPVLFTSTLRKNLDPFDLYSDAELWSAIDKAHLRKTVEALPEGLESQISSGGENLSVGQRQLVCIARAVLRKSKIVMMDEATASIDRETDALIQESIRTCFEGATLLVIAHRLETILDLDYILVMDAGQVAEFGPVQTLLADKSGKLSALVKAASSAH